MKVTEDLHATGETDLGVAVHNVFNYIKTTKQPYDALAFLTDQYSSLEDDEVLSLKGIKEAFMEGYGSDVKMKDVFGEDSGIVHISIPYPNAA